jgi:hypothetical protein
MVSFGEKLLKKYGWSEGRLMSTLTSLGLTGAVLNSGKADYLIFSILCKGEGIGKDSQGIVKPVKASFKFDQTGVCIFHIALSTFKCLIE